MGFMGFGPSHIVKIPNPFKDDIPPVLRSEGENETRTGAKTAETLGRITNVQKLRPPLAFPLLPRKAAPKYSLPPLFPLPRQLSVIFKQNCSKTA